MLLIMRPDLSLFIHTAPLDQDNILHLLLLQQNYSLTKQSSYSVNFNLNCQFSILTRGKLSGLLCYEHAGYQYVPKNKNIEYC